MAFHEREYDLYVLMGDPNSSPLWLWPQWVQAAALLSPIIAAGRGKPAVRSLQFSSEGGRTIPFGRLGWDERSHQKWAHLSPFNGPPSAGWRFVHMEAWSPSWTTCKREIAPPDVYVAVSNEGPAGGFQQVLAFNPVVVLAAGVEMAAEIRASARTCALSLASLVQAKLAVTKRRSWGRAAGSGFSGAISDLASVGLFRLGRRHERPVDLATLAEPFEPLRT